MNYAPPVEPCSQREPTCDLLAICAATVCQIIVRRGHPREGGCQCRERPLPRYATNAMPHCCQSALRPSRRIRRRSCCADDEYLLPHRGPFGSQHHRKAAFRPSCRSTLGGVELINRFRHEIDTVRGTVQATRRISIRSRVAGRLQGYDLIF